MLNYIWIALIVLGICTALWIDSSESLENKYNNHTEIPVEIRSKTNLQDSKLENITVDLVLLPESFNKFYDNKASDTVVQPIKISLDKSKKHGTFYFNTITSTPVIWKEMAKVNGKEDDLAGRINVKAIRSDSSAIAYIEFEEVSFVKMKEITSAVLSYASTAVEIAIGLIGIMALWLGIMKIADEAGIIKIIGNMLRPITKFLFPEIPSDHPAMGAMIMNISANMLGLSNAATPFGLKAMDELDKLNPNKGTATNAMVTFLAVNTAGLTLIPATAIAVRASLGSVNPAIIIGTSIFGAGCATIMGVFSAKVLEKFSLNRIDLANLFRENYKKLLYGLIIIALLFTIILTGIGSKILSLLGFINPVFIRNFIQIISIVAIPLIILTFILYGFFKKVKVYEKFVEGAKEGFNVAIRIIPYLVGMLMAIGIFRAGGAMDLLIMILRPATDLIGMPAEALPMALMRPLSGSGSLGIMTEIIKTHGPDSFVGILVSTFFGSSETTFYVLAVYFGSVNIVKTRHAVAVGLIADIAGVLGALFIVKQLFG